MLEESNETIFQMWAQRNFSDNIFFIAISSNITLHDPFLRIIIWTTRLYTLQAVYHA